MLKNYFRVALRNLTRNRSTSMINIGGLALGMAVAMLIGLWVYDEISYNTYHEHYNRIAQVEQNQDFNGDIQTWRAQALQLGPELRTRYGAYFKQVIMTDWPGDHLITIGEKKLNQTGMFMEPGAPEMLSLHMLQGSRRALEDPGSVLLTASMARAVFGDADPMNKVLMLDNKLPVKVAGVYEDLPHNTTFSELAFIAPWALKIQSEGLEKKVGWGNSWFQTYVQVADHVDINKASVAIRNAKADKVIHTEGARFHPQLFLHPMSKWHLYAEFKNGVNVGGRIQYVWLFGITGIFVLLLACINFMNLSTARSEKRAKEVGIRKAIGSMRGQLIGQFFSESILVAMLAFVLSLGLVQLMLAFFNEVADKKLSLPWGSPGFWLVATGFTLLTGLIAGSYPALYLSSFKPVKVLKGAFRVGRNAAIPRKALVVLQFTVSAILVIGTIVVFRQIQYARNRPVGYTREGLVMVPINSDELRTHYEAFRRDLMESTMVQEVAGSESQTTNTYISNSDFIWKGKAAGMSDEFVTMGITPEYGKATHWQIREGRDFSRDLATDTSCFVINEAAVRYMGLKNPVGETMQWGNIGSYRIIGVVKDMVVQSPYEPAKQMLFYIPSKRTDFSRMSYINIRINPGAGLPDAIARIGELVKKYDPVNPFVYRFADQEYAKKFGNEQRIGKLASAFAILAVFISCLGLFGLVSFVAEQRTREIGVRKVLGASVFNVWRLLSKDFVVLVFISLLVAGPLSWYFMRSWLEHYVYRTEISWWIFALVGLSVLVITLATVSVQSIRAAMANPVKSLRSE